MSMKIAAWSDGHGSLPQLKTHVDVLLIAGDFINIYIQRNTEKSLEWFLNNFFNYVATVDADKVIITPGNHDFVFERISIDRIKQYINDDETIKNKLVYLVDEAYEYMGHNFYGTPWCTGPYGWAFCPCDTKSNIDTYFNYIPEDCDILISHQPPKVDKVGCSNPYMVYEENYGSDYLRDILDKRNIKLHFCGHIHTGIHNGVPYGNTMVYNVSVKNEDYIDVYDVTYVEL